MELSTRLIPFLKETLQIISKVDYVATSIYSPLDEYGYNTKTNKPDLVRFFTLKLTYI
jgi:hypothetical protein